MENKTDPEFISLLRTASTSIYVACDEAVADHVSQILQEAAKRIEKKSEETVAKQLLQAGNELEEASKIFIGHAGLPSLGGIYLQAAEKARKVAAEAMTGDKYRGSIDGVPVTASDEAWDALNKPKE